jgi:cell division protein YceG involved in septum cleavage
MLLRLSVRSLLMVAALVFTGVVQAAPETPEEFVKVFQSGGQLEQEKAAQSLEWTGISSPQLFDLIEAAALKSLPQATDKVTINYVAHLTKALSYSGNEKYRATIEKVIAEAPHKKLRKHAQQALPTLAVYAKLNPLIAPQSWPTSAHPSLNQRLANMLKSDNTELIRAAAKRIHSSQDYQPELMALLNGIIEKNYQQALDRERLDALAWVTRAIAGSRNLQYKPTVEKVANAAADKKLRKYATKYLSYYGK